MGVAMPRPRGWRPGAARGRRGHLPGPAVSGAGAPPTRQLRASQGHSANAIKGLASAHSHDSAQPSRLRPSRWPVGELRGPYREKQRRSSRGTSIRTVAVVQRLGAELGQTDRLP